MKAIGLGLVALGVATLACLTGDGRFFGRRAMQSPFPVQLCLATIGAPAVTSEQGVPGNELRFHLPAWLARPDYPGMVHPVNPPQPVPPALGPLPRRQPLVLPMLPPRKVE
jgi:hypothetical protein